jgi:hypothetical protein
MGMDKMLPKGMLRDVTDEEVGTYAREGVAKLTAILAPDIVERLGAGIDEAFYKQWGVSEGVQSYNGSQSADEMKAAGVAVLTDPRAEAIAQADRGRFISLIGAHTVNGVIRDFALNSRRSHCPVDLSPS